MALKAKGLTSLNPAQQQVLDQFLNPYQIDQSNPVQRGFNISGEGAGFAVASIGGARSSAGGPRSSGSARSVYSSPQNWRKIDSYTHGYRYRVPDRLILDSSGTARAIGELKKVKYQAATSQIRDYARFAKERGIPFYLFINKSATLSKRLLRLADADEVRIVQR